MLRGLPETKLGSVMDEGENCMMRRSVICTNAMGSGFKGVRDIKNISNILVGKPESKRGWEKIRTLNK
jgi:hypothetical protein